MDRFNANSADCAFTIREFITICGFASRLSSTFYFFPFLFFFLLHFSTCEADVLIYEYKYLGRRDVYSKFPTGDRAYMFFSLSLSLAFVE